MDDGKAKEHHQGASENESGSDRASGRHEGKSKEREEEGRIEEGLERKVAEGLGLADERFGDGDPMPRIGAGGDCRLVVPPQNRRK